MMALSPEERRRRQAIDRDPANKCRSAGCGNTARLNEEFCGAHMPDGLTEIERRIVEREARLDELENNISNCPLLPALRAILLEIVRNLR